MRVINALTGELILECSSAAALALEKPLEFVRAIVTECSIVVLSGKVLCDDCGATVACSCEKPCAECTCSVLKSEAGRKLCHDCNMLAAAIQQGEEDYQR